MFAEPLPSVSMSNHCHNVPEGGKSFYPFIKTSSTEANTVPDTQSVVTEHYLDEGINVNHIDLP